MTGVSRGLHHQGRLWLAATSCELHHPNRIIKITSSAVREQDYMIRIISSGSLDH